MSHTPSDAPTAPASRAAWTALVLLTLVNLLNYLDRFVITALLPAIQVELDLDDTAGGLLGTAFILVYALASPVFGWLGDRGPRRRTMVFGAALWSLATGCAGFARSFSTLFMARAAVGIGEASYGTIAPAFLADLFPKSRRGWVMSVFFLAIPVGSALGYLLGGVIGAHLGWRQAFFLVGFPGLLCALALSTIREPRRGAQDGGAAPAPPLGRVYRELIGNRLYVWTVLGYTAYTFALGGLAFWAPSYLMRVRELPQDRAGVLFGGLTVVAGIVGTLGGGLLGDRLLRRTRKAYAWLGVVAVSVGALFILGALLTADLWLFFLLLGLGEVALFANTGPINALIVNVVSPAIRATASAVSILTIHLLGDAISPALIGRLSDAAGLEAAMLAVPAVFLLAAGLWGMTLWPRRSRAE